MKKHHWFRNIGSRATNAAANFPSCKNQMIYICIVFALMAVNSSIRIIRYRGLLLHYRWANSARRTASSACHSLDTNRGWMGRVVIICTGLVRLWLNMFFNFSIMPLRVASLPGTFLCVVKIMMLGVAVAPSSGFRRSAGGAKTTYVPQSVCFPAVSFLFLGSSWRIRWARPI